MIEIPSLGRPHSTSTSHSELMAEVIPLGVVVALSPPFSQRSRLGDKVSKKVSVHDLGASNPA